MNEEGKSAHVYGIRPAPLSEAQLEKSYFHAFESRAGFKIFTVKKGGSLACPQDTPYYLFHCRKVRRPEGVREMTNLKSTIPRWVQKSITTPVGSSERQR